MITHPDADVDWFVRLVDDLHQYSGARWGADDARLGDRLARPERRPGDRGGGLQVVGRAFVRFAREGFLFGRDIAGGARDRERVPPFDDRPFGGAELAQFGRGESAQALLILLCQGRGLRV
jgi:hypothetical protein